QRCEHSNEQRTVHLIANGKTITATVEGKIHPVSREAMLPLTFEHLVKDQLAQQLGFCTATQFDVFHLTVDVPFLVGQEEVLLTAAADQRLPFEPLQALTDVPTQGQTVSVDLIQAERHEVLDGALHFIDVAYQEEHV